MKTSKENLFENKFSHIYIENDVKESAITKKILKHFRASRIIFIENYKDVFNKRSQNYATQRKSPKLILAKKRDNLLYKGSNMCDSFGHDNFYYATSAMNCIYDCEYCYLQGLYPSANLVVFVNLEETFEFVERLIAKEKLYVCISYDTDLLAIEKLTGFVKAWIDFINKKNNLVIELRTKSANFNLVSDMKQNKNFILAYSLSPQEIIDSYEHNTPSLESRIKSICDAMELGWQVRICMDPVLMVNDWENIYFKAVKKIKEEININKLQGISIGSFRVGKEFIKPMRKANSESSLLAFPFVINDSENYIGYPSVNEKNMIEYINKLFIGANT